MSGLKILVSSLWLILSGVASYNAYTSALDSDSWQAAIEMALLMLGGFGVVITLIHQAESIAANTIQLREKMEFDKIENAFILLRDWDNPSLLDARRYTREVGKDREDISNSDLLKRIEESSDLEHSLVATFNFWEQVYFSILKQRADEDVLKQAFKDIYISMYLRFEVWLRKQSDAVKFQSSLAELYERWKS